MGTDVTLAAPGGTLAPYGSVDSFAAAQRIAQSLAASTIIPSDYKGSVANCLVALELASRLNASPLMVMQATHIIHGRPFLAATFVAAAINSCGRFKPLKFRWEGETGHDDRSCTAWTTDMDGDELEGPTISMLMARAEGWIDKKGSKWQTMPDLMLRYRAITFFGRIYASDILMGMHTAEEAADMNMIDVSPDAGGVQAQLPPRVKDARPPAEVVSGTATELPPKVGENDDPEDVSGSGEQRGEDTPVAADGEHDNAPQPAPRRSDAPAGDDAPPQADPLAVPAALDRSHELWGLKSDGSHMYEWKGGTAPADSPAAFDALYKRLLIDFQPGPRTERERDIAKAIDDANGHLIGQLPGERYGEIVEMIEAATADNNPLLGG